MRGIARVPSVKEISGLNLPLYLFYGDVIVASSCRRGGLEVTSKNFLIREDQLKKSFYRPKAGQGSLTCQQELEGEALPF